ncbi:MAG: GNAT family N-acetyltransferase [Gemmatimonadota bacterium]|nr:GNAT family N-acetyltransferase [Gemmatimonadota bacterium]
MGPIARRRLGRMVDVYDSLEAFTTLEEAWEALETPARSPFLTHAWIRAWWSAFPEAAPVVLTLKGDDGELRAAASLMPSRRTLRGATNAYTEHWDVIAADPTARTTLWREIAARRSATILLSGVPAGSASVPVAVDVLRSAGYRVAVSVEQRSPILALPETWDDLLAAVSRNLRSQVRRYTKRLAHEGTLVFRTTTEERLEQDLRSFLVVEGSGWKGAAGTAIRSDPCAIRLYTEFARGAARRGSLRLQVLELDGAPIAVDYTCVVGDSAFLLKTGFDERYARVSPGLVLRAHALQAAIGERLRFYDFLGGPDRYKVQWTAELRERLLIRAYGGITGPPTFLYRHRLRPAGRRLVLVGRRALDRSRSVSAPRGRYRDQEATS